MEEDFPARIEAVFPDRDSAAAAAKALSQRFDCDEAQLNLVSSDPAEHRVHRNRYAFKDSGRRLQRRQILATLVAFLLIGIGLIALEILGVSNLHPVAAGVILSALVLGAVAITVIGMLSWRPARIPVHHRPAAGETVLVVHVHGVEDQYLLRDALLQMGARIEGGSSASVS
jgi:hypothetical protein